MKARKAQRQGAARIPQEQLQAIAEELGIPVESITLPMLVKISDDPLFLDHLTACKDDPKMLSLLLEGGSQSEAQPEFRTAELLSRVSVAMTRWAASGFGKVPQDTYRDRIAECQTCEHLSSPPNSKIYRMAGLSQEKSVCGLCGCSVRRKAALPTERCPDGRWEAVN